MSTFHVDTFPFSSPSNSLETWRFLTEHFRRTSHPLRFLTSFDHNSIYIRVYTPAMLDHGGDNKKGSTIAQEVQLRCVLSRTGDIGRAFMLCCSRWCHCHYYTAIFSTYTLGTPVWRSRELPSMSPEDDERITFVSQRSGGQYWHCKHANASPCPFKATLSLAEHIQEFLFLSLKPQYDF